MTSQNVRKESLTKECEFYCRKIIISFNSSSYDLNSVKPVIIQQLLEKIEFAIKKENDYLSIKT